MDRRALPQSLLLPALLALSLGDLPARAQGGLATARSSRRRRSRGDLVARGQALARETLLQNTRRIRLPGVGRQRLALQAGSGHFAAEWTRDAMFASLGALAVGQTEVVRDSIQNLLDRQAPDGLLPRRLGPGKNTVAVAMHALLRKLPDPSRPYRVAEYDSSLGHEVIDSNPLVVWLASEYAARTGDVAFARRNFERFERAMRWLEGRAGGGLLEQSAYGDWKDTVARGGKVLYSNALYYRSLLGFAELARMVGRPQRADRYAKRAEQLRSRIQTAFWDPKKGRFRDSDTLDHFSADGNLLAVYFGIATPRQATSVIDRAIRELRLPSGLFALLDRPYPKRMIPLGARLIGLGGYGNSFVMTWNTSLFALAAKKVGRLEAADQALSAVARLALRDGTFSEYYEKKRPSLAQRLGLVRRPARRAEQLVPVKRLLYRSEPEFSWSAGMFLRATAELRPPTPER